MYSVQWASLHTMEWDMYMYAGYIPKDGGYCTCI